MDYKGVEVIIRQQSVTADPLEHPVDAMTIGVKTFGMGAWVSVAQIVSLLVEALGGEMPYEHEIGETELGLEKRDAIRS